jgi:signal transduction histidine kinase
MLLLILFLPAVALATTPIFAGSKHATKEEAQAMATKAADFLKKEGSETAFAAFNAGGDWRNGDLYVFVLDKTGTWRASGARPELVGKNELNTADADGKLFIKEIVAIDKTGWVDYKFKSPADDQVHQVHPKNSYFVRVGDFLVGAGAYKY